MKTWNEVAEGSEFAVNFLRYLPLWALTQSGLGLAGGAEDYCVQQLLIRVIDFCLNKVVILSTKTAWQDETEILLRDEQSVSRD